MRVFDGGGGSNGHPGFATIPLMNHTPANNRRLTQALAASLLVSGLSLGFLSGCQKQVEEKKKNYAKQLLPGESGLRKLAPEEIPNMAAVMAQFSDPSFREALAKSVAWYAKKSSPGIYAKRSAQGSFQNGEISTITFDKAAKSASAFQNIFLTAASVEEAERRVRERFDVYASVGCDDKDTVLFTAYHSPIYSASKDKVPPFVNPIYKRPSDLPAADSAGAYPSRAELYDSGKLSGLEFVYLADPLDAYAIEVNGSAKLNMADGSIKYVGFHGTNGHEYTSIGKLLVADGKISADRISLQAIRDFFGRHPEQLQDYIRRNERLPFFTEYPAASWPSGCLGFPVTTQRTIATDKLVFPSGAVAWVKTGDKSATGPIKPIDRLMMDQDAGGAIRAAGRADLYLGTGPEAEKIAGDLAAEGNLYYFFLKDEYLK